jgi:outer membrane protein OmpA-like peptidoglycan-associated protein/opacity protein-like surface antigen
MKRFGFAVFCLMLIMATASGFAYDRSVGLGVKGGYGLLAGADDKEGEFEERADGWLMGNFILRRSVSRHWSMGLKVGYGFNYDKDSKSYRTNLVPIDLNAIYNFMPEERFSPYLSGGFGIVHWTANHRPNEPELESQRDPAFCGGGGLDIFLNDIIALDVNYTFRYMLTDDKDMIGRSYRAEGLASNDKFLHYVAVGVTWYPSKPKDSDGDGVRDSKDKCPNTPMGCIVDEVGCEIDSDGDGVCDGLDRCPNTPRGCKVDDDGCPIDSDGDGVCDGLDKCPDTPEDMHVDMHGCPKLPDLARIESILFRFDDSDVIPKPNPVLDEIVEIMMAYPDARIEIHGHTDSIGSEEYNMKLGKRRAEAVKAYMVDHGVAAGRMETESFGETKPIGPNDTKLGRRANRRVEFHLIK